VDVGTITPATRDLLQALSTRKKSLALAALLDDEQRPEDEAARLDEIGAPAFAFAVAAESMQRAARSTKSVPALCLAPLRERQACLEARWFGADGVCIDGALSADAWASLAGDARSTRMMALGFARDAVEATRAVAAGARGLLVAPSPSAPAAGATGQGWAGVLQVVDSVLAAVSRGTLVVVHVEGADAELLRALRGRADAAVVPAAVHRGDAFAGLLAELES
jgi:hypothetical protein